MTRPHVEPSWHLFANRHQRCDELQRHLASQGFETVVHYPIPCHLQPAYAALRLRMPDLSATGQLAARVLSLPMGPHVSDDQVTHVVEAIGSSCRSTVAA